MTESVPLVPGLDHLDERTAARLAVAWLQGYRNFNLVRGKLRANYRGERQRKVPDPIHDEEDAVCLRVWLVHKHYRVATSTTMLDSECTIGHPGSCLTAIVDGRRDALLDPDEMERIAVVRAALRLLPEETRAALLRGEVPCE